MKSVFWRPSFVLFCSLIVLGLIARAQFANALPFNDDMVGKQLITGTVMRQKPAGAIPVGSLDRRLESREAALPMVNPVKGDPQSPARGQRLFAEFCTPCHGHWESGKHVPSAILEKGMPSMDLASDNIKFSDFPKNEKLKPDGHYFGYAYLGGIIMPAYGWKLANAELWDIVSYIRKVQAEVAAGAAGGGK